MENLEEFVKAGFARIKAQQGAQQGSRLDKSLAALRSHFDLDNPETVEQLHKSVAEPSDEDSAYAARRIKQARQRSRIAGFDQDLPAPQEDSPGAYGDAPVQPHPDQEPLWQPGAWLVQAQQEAILRAGVQDAQDRIRAAQERSRRWGR
jgi:hypothetical protein